MLTLERRVMMPAREGVPTATASSDVASSSAGPAEDKTEIVNVTKAVKQVEVDKPVGKPAEKKMPKSEKQKAPESKAMPRQKACHDSVSKQMQPFANLKKQRNVKRVQCGWTPMTWPTGSPRSTAARGA